MFYIGLFLVLQLTATAQVPADSSKADSLRKINTDRIKNIKDGNAGRDTTIVVAPTQPGPIEADTISKSALDSLRPPKHSAKKAALYSALLPGLGQIYNKKWWKVPIIYAAFGGVGYAIAFNQKYYSDFKQALIYRLDQKPETVDPYESKYTAANLDELQSFYRKNRDLSIIICAGVYALNILDATVDAHLFDFDVSNDLSLRVQPAPLFMPGNLGGGLALTLKFK